MLRNSPRRDPAAYTASRSLVKAACWVTALPVLVDLASNPKVRPFGYVAADAFYYLSVARNMVTQGSVSMDGMHPINGFHPLWQLIAAVCYGLAHWIHQTDYALLALVLASLAFVSGTIWLLGQTLTSVSRRLSVLFLTLPFGFYALLVLPPWLHNYDQMVEFRAGEGPIPLYGTLYSHVNGMESSLTVFAFALLASVYVRHSLGSNLRAGLACGSALAFLVLARLDHAALALVPWGLWTATAFHDSRRRRFALGALVSSIGPLLAYLAINKLYAGVALPISGVAKSTFPIPRADGMTHLVEYFGNPLSYPDLFRLYRIAPQAISLLSTLTYLAVVVRIRGRRGGVGFELRPFTTRFDAFLALMSPGIILLNFYNLFYCSGIGHWYFPVSTLCVSLNILALWRAISEKLTPRGVSIRWIRLPMGAGILVLTLIGFWKLHRQVRYHERYAHFCHTVAPRVKQALNGKVPKLLEHDDGVVGYCLDAPAMSGTGLTLDAVAVRAHQDGHFFQLAVHRGYRALTTLFYRAHDLDVHSSPEAVRGWAASMMGAIPTGYDAKLLYGDADFTIVELTGPECRCN